MLSAHPLLACFSTPVAKKLEEQAEIVEFQEGDILFKENDPSDFVYAVISGEVALEKEASPGHYVLISTVGGGDFFGELGILYHTGRATRARMSLTGRLAKIDGHQFWMALREEPVEVSVKLMGRVLGYLNDTNRRYLAELLRKEKLQFLGEMANALVHDFKNPVTGILLAVGLISDMHPDEKTQIWCKMIREHCQHMMLMTRDLLDFSWGQKHFHREWVELNSLFDTFVFLNSALVQNSGVAFSRECDALRAHLDRNAMLRVLQNLVDNAVEAARPSGGNVKLSGRQEDRSIVIEVTDTGCGIPLEIRERVFEPFVTMGKQKGTGLGLAIAQSFVQAHGGTLSFVTEVGQGTTFQIRLPLLEAEPTV
jgi:signal transduction histidine kinase